MTLDEAHIEIVKAVHSYLAATDAEEYRARVHTRIKEILEKFSLAVRKKEREEWGGPIDESRPVCCQHAWMDGYDEGLYDGAHK